MPLSELLKTPSAELNAELQLILNAMIEGLCGVDAAGNATFCNDALLKMTGYRAEEFIGSNLHDLLHHGQPDGRRYPEEECAFREALVGDQPIHCVGGTLWRKDGTSFLAEYRTIPLQRPANQTVYVATFRDLSEIQRTRDGLRQSEEKFRRILASVPDVVWTSDRQGRTIYISPKAEAVFGYTKHEICASGDLWLGRIHPEDFGRVKQSYTALFEQQNLFDEEYRIRRKDGEWIWVHSRALGTHVEHGIPYADGVLTDITRRKQAEAELQSKTALLEAQANSTIDGMLIVDGRGQRVMQNRRLAELFHIPPEMLRDTDDRNMLQYVVTLLKDPKSFMDSVEHLYRHPSETSRDEIEFKDGTILDRYSSPVIDANGIYYGRIWTFRDITERKRNEDTLRQLSMAVEQSPVSVVITDPQGDITYVNRKFTESTGYEPEEVLGKSPRVLNSGRSPADLYRCLWSTITQGREWRGEFCNKKKNGEIYSEAATIRPITNSAGAITHFLAIKEDITERKNSEKELLLAQFSLEHASDAIFRVAPDGRIVYVNAQACRSSERTREELLSLTIPDIDPLFSKEAWAAFWEDVKVRGAITLETLQEAKQGRVFPVEVTANYVKLDGQEYVFSFVRDLTERKRAEEKVRESNELVRLVLDSVPEAVYGIDVQGKCTFCNPSCLRLLAYQDTADLHGKDMHALIHHSRRDGTPYPVEECHIYEAFRRGQGTHIDDELLWRCDGTSFAAEYWSQPIHRGEKVIGTVVTFVNITDRKRVETELRLTQFSVEHASDAIEWVDAQARIVYANEASCRRLGFSHEELLALSIPDLDPLFPKELWPAFWEKLKTQGSMTFETQHRTKQGRIFPVEITANYLEFDGQEYGFSFVRDLTERKELEGQLRHAQKLEGIGQLAAGIAHEINTPIQFVSDNLTFLRDSWESIHGLLERYRSVVHDAAGTLAPQAIADLEEAERNCDLEFIADEAPRAIDQSLDGAGRVARIVRAMKEFSHPDSAEKTATDLNRAIESTITVARNEWKYVAEVVSELNENLSPVICYPGDINQVILNLVVNAAHAIHEKLKDKEKGEIKVSTRPQGEFVEIAITDNGTGVPENIRDRIFDPFFTTKDVGNGTGQGLAFAHSVIVKKHGGKIWFETETGRGTTFFINLPIGSANS